MYFPALRADNKSLKLKKKSSQQFLRSLEKNHKKEKQVIYHKKGGPNKTKPAKWTQVFSTAKKKRKRRAKYVSDTKEKRRQKEEREYIQRINDLSKPMPKKFWYGRKRLY